MENFILLAMYNAKMNGRVHQACQKLGNDELNKDRKAFFGSILGTMNHLIVADTIWLQRLANHPAHFSSLEVIRALPKPAALNQVLFTELHAWHERRLMLDDVIEKLMFEIKPALLDSILSYHRTDGTPGSKRLKDVLLHFFNHQTHHRGQISTLLFQAGVDIGVTDLLAMVPDVEKT